MEQTNVHHGTKDGRLSSRQYAKTWGELKGGKAPTRPYYKRSEKMDISIACGIVVDQSSSMSGLKRDTIKGMLALADALNSVGAATQVTGFRYGGYHRQVHGVQTERSAGGNACIDIFQQYGEKFTAVKGRFSHLRASGGTPTADGMQYALEGLSERPEAYRVMFVLTDGCPDGGHQPIINRQIRLAKEAGIHVVGVGLGYGTQGVVSSYPDHIVAENMAQLPEKLLAKLRDILKPSANKRGRRVAS
jgi:nitric oxide reductase activation protein